jgi:Zn-dependent metalloprotease
MNSEGDGFSYQGIVPPHMLEAIIKNGSQAQQQAAQETFAISQRIREGRVAQLAGVPPASRETAGAPHKNRKSYTAAHKTNLPGTLVRSEGQPAASDVAINEAYDGLGATFDLYWDVYQRNSIDNAGMDMIGTVHFSNNYNNAFFNGSQMVFGDGDGNIFNRFTIAIDVIGHELTHGVTAATAKLEYHDQPGALNESISDVFGSLVKQRTLGQTAAQADWLIGAGLLASGINGVALRSMKAPGTAYNDPVLGKDPQPDHMSKYVNTSSDNGGVHINSGIPNKAFYLAATALGGNAWGQAGNIWYQALLDSRTGTTAQFQDFANLTVDNANRLYGATASNAVVQAWAGVGITVAPVLTWQNNKSVLSAFTSAHSMNAWAYIQDVGWRKIQPLTTDGVTNMFTLLVDAHAFNKKVNVYVDGSLIYQAYCV